MNQSIFGGCGNYIKAEALYKAKLSPHRKCDSLTDDEASELHAALQDIVWTSYKSNGATIATYRDANGNVGSYSSKFAVYGRKEDPLGNAVTSEETKDGRTTWWVPNVQR